MLMRLIRGSGERTGRIPAARSRVSLQVLFFLLSIGPNHLLFGHGTLRSSETVGWPDAKGYPVLRVLLRALLSALRLLLQRRALQGV